MATGTWPFIAHLARRAAFFFLAQLNRWMFLKGGVKDWSVWMRGMCLFGRGGHRVSVLSAGRAVTVMAIVAAHAAVRLNVEDGTKKVVVNALLMRPGEVRASTTRARKTGGPKKDVLHPGFTLLLLEDIRLAQTECGVTRHAFSPEFPASGPACAESAESD